MGTGIIFVVVTKFPRTHPIVGKRYKVGGGLIEIRRNTV